ncbi:MAG: hypothetical protein ACTSYM_11940 [Candidatus Baldrarchaeia archaeon]
MKEKTLLISAATGILGILYFVYAGIMLYNWIAGTFIQEAESVNNVLGLFVPSDPGCVVALITIGMLLLGSLYYGLNNVKGVSCIFLGSLLGTAMLIIQILVVLANMASIEVSFLSGEIVEYTVVEDVLRPEITLGIGSIMVLFFSALKIRQITGK